MGGGTNQVGSRHVTIPDIWRLICTTEMNGLIMQIYCCSVPRGENLAASVHGLIPLTLCMLPCNELPFPTLNLGL